MAANIDTTAVTSALGVGSEWKEKVIAQSTTKVLPQKQELVLILNNIMLESLDILRLRSINVENALNVLNDKNDFNVITSVSSDSSAVTVEVDRCDYWRHEIEVSRLAYAQRSASAGFSAGTATINSGNAFNVNMTVGGVTTTVQLNNSAQLTESSAFSSNTDPLNGGSAIEVELTINGSKSTLVNAGSDTPQGI